MPITQAIQLQMVRNLPFADHLIRFSPTLSPANLAPSAAAIDRACQWGADNLAEAVPVIDALRRPVWWQGDHPVAERRSSTETTGSVAASMGAVFAALREQTGPLQRWRDRRLT